MDKAYKKVWRWVTTALLATAIAGATLTGAWPGVKRWVSVLISVAGTTLMYLLGGWDAALMTMFVAMGLDYATGLLCSFSGASSKTETGHYASYVAFKGITKKMLMLVIVAVATMADRLLGTDGVCRIAAIGFYVSNEGMSIIENASAMGVPFPKGLLDTLERIRKKSDDTVVGTETKKDTEDESL